MLVSMLNLAAMRRSEFRFSIVITGAEIQRDA
jgi:hypothetical protein